MNIVHFGERYQVYGDSMQTYEQLPVGTYEICFDKMSGFYLSDHDELTAINSKIYGTTPKKVDKVMNAFNAVDRNFGVILSGEKGIGKSLFARLLAVKAKDNGFPVIIANTYFPGISNFISSIQQEVVVIFDEFEKSFKDSEEYSPQEELLPMFDGIDCGKKLFVITCNEVEMLNPCLLNRPGRFHYHFVFESPSVDDIKVYMKDMLKEEYHGLIDRIAAFSMYANITYDILRAIAFEINRGYSIEETLHDLNINSGDSPLYDVVIRLSCGATAISRNSDVGLGRQDDCTKRLYCYTSSDKYIRITFNTKDISLDSASASIVIDPNKVNMYAEDEFDLSKDEDAKIFYDVKNHNLEGVEFVKSNRSRFAREYAI